jgi:hypothetical protein
MRSLTVALLSAAFLGAFGSASAKTKHHQARKEQPRQMSCTMSGCIPVPPGCRNAPNSSFWGDYDTIVCSPVAPPIR